MKPSTGWTRTVLQRLRRGPPPSSLEQARQSAIGLVCDLAPGQRHFLIHCIENAADRNAMRALRPSLFDALALAHGEAVARQRLRHYDLALG